MVIYVKFVEIFNKFKKQSRRIGSGSRPDLSGKSDGGREEASLPLPLPPLDLGAAKPWIPVVPVDPWAP